VNSPAKIALVTGGAHRVGRAIAIALAQAGWDVAITYNQSRDEATDTVDALRQSGRRAVAIKADFTRPEKAVASVKTAIHKQLGKVQVLVNNASIYLPDADPSDARRMWAVHVETPLLLCRALAGDLQANGRVINMLDAMALKPWPKFAAYCTTKAALWNLTLSLARELAPKTTVNGIAPGVVLWPPGFPAAEKKKYLSKVPLGRAGTPEDVARTVLFFCRDADYVTGQMLLLDGGRSLQ